MKLSDFPRCNVKDDRGRTGLHYKFLLGRCDNPDDCTLVHVRAMKDLPLNLAEQGKTPLSKVVDELVKLPRLVGSLRSRVEGRPQRAVQIRLRRLPAVGQPASSRHTEGASVRCGDPHLHVLREEQARSRLPMHLSHKLLDELMV